MMTLVKAFLTHFTYLALIAVLLAAGFGAPIPEDIPLAFSGYLCNRTYSPIPDVVEMVDADHDGIPEKEIRHRHVPHLFLMILAGMVGVLTGDTFVFHVGRHGIDSNNFIAHHLRKVMHSKRREKAERHFHKHGSLTVFAGRFMPGLRSLVFAMAGMSKMSYTRFILIDGLAAGISVPLFVWLGWKFAGDINGLFHHLERIKHIVFPIAAAAALIAITLYYFRKRSAKPEAEGESEPARSEQTMTPP